MKFNHSILVGVSNWVARSLILAALALSLKTDANAQIDTLASFNGGTQGLQPFGGLTLSGSTFYGTTSAGGAGGYGTIFSVPLSGGTPTILASFNGTDGEYPAASLTLSGSTLYGTTYYGGTNDDGTVFSLPLSGGTPTVLASFNGTNGAAPYVGLTLSGSTLYGTTSAGGISGNGTVFSIQIVPESSSYALLGMGLGALALGIAARRKLLEKD